ncbi:MAG: tetratricopeptide repeat protein [Siphonobacter sp.]
MKVFASRILMGLLVCATLIPVSAQKKKKEPPTTEQLAEAERFASEGTKFYVLDELDKAIPQFQKTLEINPDDAGANYSLALIYNKKGELEKALPFAEKAFLTDAENKYMATILAELYEKQRRFPEAIKLYQLLLTREPENSEYAIELASLFIQQDRFDDALKIYADIEKTVGLSEEITRQKQLILLKQGKVNEAVKEGDALIASDPAEVEYKVEQAELLMTHDRSEQAIPLLEKILEQRPGNAQAHIMLAELYRKKGDVKRCNEELAKAFADPTLDPTTKARVLTSYMAMLPQETQNGEALNFAKMLVKDHPEQAQGHVILGDLLIQRNDKAGARNSYIKAARLDGSLHEVWQRIIQLDGDLNQMDSVIAHSEEAIELFPNQALFWYANGSAYLAKRNYEKAIEGLEEAKRLSSDQKLAVFIQSQLGDAYNALGKYEASDLAYEEALKADPNNEHVLNNYGYFLALRKTRLDKALEMTSRLVKLYPNNATFVDTHAWVYFVKGEYSTARTLLEKALQLDTSNGTIWEHYGDVLFQLGEKEKALEQWRKAKSLGQTSDRIERKISTGSL